MKDQWLKDIHERMADFEVDEPSGLWAAVGKDCHRMRAGRRRHVVSVWLNRASDVAAMIAVVLAVFFLSPDREDVVSGFPDIVPEERMPASPRRLYSAENGDRDEDAYSVGRDRKTAEEAVVAQIVADRPETADSEVCPDIAGVNDDTHDDGPEQQAALSDTVVRHIDKDMKTAEKREYGRHYAKMTRLESGNNKGRFSVGAFTSGGIDMTKRSAGSMGYAADVAGSDDAVWTDSPMLGLLLFNKGRDVVTEVKHRLPIRTGVTLAYRLNDRVALETGLVYTNLTSDLKYGGDDNYMSGSQTLHYIGLPLNVKYRVFSWRRFDVYASAGILGEKCVSGKIENKYTFEGQNDRTEPEDAKVRPLQWSLNVSAGLQYNVANTVGIYAEPGLGYYIDNGSPVRTIYKDRPLNFNLNIGLRLTVGSGR